MAEKNVRAQSPADVHDTVGLKDLSIEKNGTTQRAINFFKGHNLAETTLTTRLSLKDFIDMSQIANRDNRYVSGSDIAQRPLDIRHAKSLAVYILKGLVSTSIKIKEKNGEEVPGVWYDIKDDMGEQPYAALQPMVVNIRTLDIKNLPYEVRVDEKNQRFSNFVLYLSQNDVLWVVDGQHRRRGMEMVVEFLKHVHDNAFYYKKGLYYPTCDPENGSMTNDELALWDACNNTATQQISVTVEIHIGLTVDEERQLFHDLNQLGKKMDINLSMRFDSSNPIVQFTKNFVLAEDKLNMKYTEKEIKDWDKDDGAILLKDYIQINSRLFANKTTPANTKPVVVENSKDIAIKFWEAVSKIPNICEKESKKNTVAAQTVVLKSLAKLVYDFAISPRKPENSDEITEKILSAIDQTGNIKFNFSHSNPAWRYYSLTEQERIDMGINTLSNYLPSEEDGNRDIGSYQEGYFRFGAKVNDIVPLICDIFRWRLNLPSRKINQ